MEISTEQLQHIVQAYHPYTNLRKSWTLTDGISAQTVAMEISLPDDTTQQIVLRVYGDKDRANNPNIAHDEFNLLDILHTVGLPVPKPYSFDLSNQILPIPYILIAYVEGKTQFSSGLSMTQIHSLVNHLIRIHQLDLSVHDLSFLPHQHNILERYLQGTSLKNNHIIDALKHVYPNLKTNPSTLLHGDYWLGNILWDEEQLVGIIDWEDARLGDPLSDLGKSRLELTWVAGQHITDQYTQLYAQQMIHLNMSYLPFWDLWGALRLADFADWFDDPNKVKKMQNLYDEFVEQAIQALQAMEE